MSIQFDSARSEKSAQPTTANSNQYLNDVQIERNNVKD